MARKSRKKSRFRFKLKPKLKKKIRQLQFVLGLLLVGSLVYFLHQHDFWSLTGKKVTKPFETVIRPRETERLPEKKEVSIPAWKRKAKKVSLDKPKIIFVIDDMGYTREHEEILIKFGHRVTYAILPMLSHSHYFSRLSQNTGAEVILHLPLEASDGTIPGRGLITNRMPATQILDVLNRNLLSVPHPIGVSNHMGSQGSRDPRIMGIILQDLKKRGLFYLDSYTTSQTVAYEIGKKIGLPILNRSVFLDNIDAKSAIRKQIELLTEHSRRRGYAIGIGHYRYNTLKIIEEEIPLLMEKGFEIISLADLLSFRYRN